MSYLKIDPKMTLQEKRQQTAREFFKSRNPGWDDTLVIFSRLFGEVAKANTNLLDLGCGRANVVIDDHRAKIARAVGIDANMEAVAGNDQLDEIVVGNVNELPFADASFDVVISQWMLEHLEYPEKAFAEVCRVLKPGGYFLFVTPYAYSSIILAKRFVGSALTKRILKRLYGREEADCFQTYYRANTEKDLVDKLAKAGFKNGTIVKNPDSSYWAFNRAVYKVALLVEKLFPKQATMHLVGVFKRA